MYLGAIASAGLISLSFGHAATDAGLHRLAVILTAAAAGLFAATLADPARLPIPPSLPSASRRQSSS